MKEAPTGVRKPETQFGPAASLTHRSAESPETARQPGRTTLDAVLGGGRAGAHALESLRASVGNYRLSHLTLAAPRRKVQRAAGQSGRPLRDGTFALRSSVNILPRCGSSTVAPERERTERRQEHLESLQRSSTGEDVTEYAPPSVHHVLGTPGKPLDEGTSAFMEERFGHDFSSVRLHTDALASASARTVGAIAYTVGNHVVMDSARYSPQTGEGRRLLAHELTHVVQQGGGSMPQEGPLEVERPGSAFEHEADHVAETVTGDSGAGPLVARLHLSPQTVMRVDMISPFDGKHYDVKGFTGIFRLSAVKDYTQNSLNEVATALESADEAGNVTTGFFQPPSVTTNKRGKVIDAAVLMFSRKTMPRWTKFSQACAPWQEEWSRFYSALDAHENRHMEIDQQQFSDFHKKLIGIPEDKVDQVVDQRVQAANEKQDKFDKDTDHGKKTGTKIDAGIRCSTKVP